MIGAGGLGSPLLMYLAAAGVGTIGIVDDDRVSLDNLQRQIVHDTPHVGVRQGRQRGRNWPGSTRTCRSRLTRPASMPATRWTHLGATTSSPTAPTTSPRAISSAMPAISRGSTLVFAAVGPFDGYLTTLKPHEAGPDGQPYPQLSLHFSGSTAAGHGGQLRRGGRVGCGRWRDGHFAGDRGAERDRRHWRELGGRVCSFTTHARPASTRSRWPGIPQTRFRAGRLRSIDLSIHAQTQDGAVCAA